MHLRVICRHGTGLRERPHAGRGPPPSPAGASHRADIWYTILQHVPSSPRTIQPGRKGYGVDLQPDGKVAIVTGARKGIGRQAAAHLAHEGADVAITARTAGPLEVTAREIAPATERMIGPLAGDMSVTEDVQRCVDAVLDRFGAIDILVTWAGRSPDGLLENLTERAVDDEPEPEVHGLCPFGARGHRAYA
jgi:hypothetical protein